MHRSLPRVTRLQLLLAAAIVLASAATAHATVIHLRAALSWTGEAAPTSLATGNVEVTIDDVANTMQIAAVFGSGTPGFVSLNGTTTACHIHAPTAVPLTGNASVATTTPFFAGFPIGVTSGEYNNTLDLTQSSSYNASFITANGGTTSSAEAALISYITLGNSYFNVHSTTNPGGEIRGFLQVFDPTPTTRSTWTRVKEIYK